MSHPTTPSTPKPASAFRRKSDALLSRGVTYVFISALILLMDVLTGRFLAFPILFVLPVALSAWYCSVRLAYTLAIFLPIGRLPIATFIEALYPAQYSVVNALVRIAVLSFIAYLVNRTACQSRALQQKVDRFVTICAWSRTVKYKGEWISFEEYLKRRFNIDTSHGISPAEAEKFAQGRHEDSDD